MKFRRIEKTDLKNCSELYAQVFSLAPWNEPWTAQAALERLSHFYESLGFCGVLVESEAVLGFALGNAEPFHTETLFYLREMCISPKQQCQGLGGRLYASLEKEISLMNVKSIYLATERAIPASNFYLKNGFRHVEEMGFYAKHVNS